ncbi:MOSC domain-containing protein [Sodiomyces alkalinus F11]|uniref:MOSC domain-containing protein n=1 Tax=Sodiomyces alkalinus (strain CBS 110278 / VKM F-3762 / F11) TaxID=1314773 RepID=A0A3N2Q1S1_SODAK|nr:MOSC domain-containing protein [Sodiomyces alkalinus F11]ROT40711.1 MOSC domain-containing protein [Sodiomyces alkalinus F11]
MTAAETLSSGPGGSLAQADPSLYAAFFLLPIITVLGFIIPFLYLFPPVPATKADALERTHTRLGLTEEESNLRDQFAARHHGDSSGHGKPKVQALCIYPVKSCKGIEITRSRVLPSGLEFDRLYTFAQLRSKFPLPANPTEGGAVKEEEKKADMADKADKGGEIHSWEFITQRQFGLLANVKVDVWVPDPAKQKTRPAEAQSEGWDEEAWIVLRFPWRDAGLRGFLSLVAAKIARGWDAVPEKEVLVPAGFPSEADIKARGYKYEEVRIWRDTVEALNLGRELPEELRFYLGVSNPLGLFMIDPGRQRDVYRCAPRREQAGYQPIVGFQDAYPLHLMSLSSFQDFDSMVAKDEDIKRLDISRFRANIITSGVPAYEEEKWKSIRLNPGSSSLSNVADFHVSCRTVRCKLPNVDPATGMRHPAEPDRSLRKHRNVDAGAPLLGCLGMQMCPLFEDAEDAQSEDLRTWVEVGMDIDVLAQGEHLYIKQ